MGAQRVLSHPSQTAFPGHSSHCSSPGRMWPAVSSWNTPQATPGPNVGGMPPLFFFVLFPFLALFPTESLDPDKPKRTLWVFSFIFPLPLKIHDKAPQEKKRNHFLNFFWVPSSPEIHDKPKNNPFGFYWDPLPQKFPGKRQNFWVFNAFVFLHPLPEVPLKWQNLFYEQPKKYIYIYIT